MFFITGCLRQTFSQLLQHESFSGLAILRFPFPQQRSNHMLTNCVVLLGALRRNTLHSSAGKNSSQSNEGDHADESCSKVTEKKKIRGKTPVGKLEELEEGKHPYQEKEPLKKHPGGVNPLTGEIGGPAGPEPTRYGDWERKGRVSDF